MGLWHLPETKCLNLHIYTRLLVYVQLYFMYVINKPPMSELMMPNLLRAKMSLKWDISAFLKDSWVSNCYFINITAFNLLNIWHLVTAFYFTFGKTPSGRRESFSLQEKAPLPAQWSLILKEELTRIVVTNSQELKSFPSTEKAGLISRLLSDINFLAIGYFREFYVTHKRTTFTPIWPQQRIMLWHIIYVILLSFHLRNENSQNENLESCWSYQNRKQNYCGVLVELSVKEIASYKFQRNGIFMWVTFKN